MGGLSLSESARQRVAVGDEWTHYSLTGLQSACGPPLCIRRRFIFTSSFGSKEYEHNQANHANTLMVLPCYRVTAIPILILTPDFFGSVSVAFSCVCVFFVGVEI